MAGGVKPTMPRTLKPLSNPSPVAPTGTFTPPPTPSVTGPSADAVPALRAIDAHTSTAKPNPFIVSSQSGGAGRAAGVRLPSGIGSDSGGLHGGETRLAAPAKVLHYSAMPST